MRERTSAERNQLRCAIGAAAIIGLASVFDTTALGDDDDRSIVIRNTTGWPDAPPEGPKGPYLSVRSTVDQTAWASAALPISLAAPTKITTFAGIMAAPAGFDWSGASWRFNVWSSLDAFAESALVGDLISVDGVTIANLDGDAPPPFGGMTADPQWQKRYVEFAIAPASVAAGEFVVGINAFSDSGEVGWAETLDPGDLSTDYGTSSINAGPPFPFADLPLSVTGVVAADIGGQLPPPPGDLNGDGIVDGADLGILLSSWGECPGCPADLNQDGIVNGEDLGILLANWTE